LAEPATRTPTVAVAIDPSGNVIVAGYTTSQTLPGTATAFQPAKASGFPDNSDVFIAKFDPSGTRLLWATFLGGAENETVTAAATDADGSIYVVGSTTSTNFPITSGAYLTVPSGAFAAKISADGTSLIYSTYLSGTPTAVAVNSLGQAYICGTTFSRTMVTAGAVGYPQAVNPGSN
jgi:hypothetical protein